METTIFLYSIIKKNPALQGFFCSKYVLPIRIWGFILKETRSMLR